MKLNFIFLFSLISLSLLAQSDRWQQEANYTMDIDFDVKNHTYLGVQTIEYTNNSSDTLNSVFYHLYFNAFQPGSMMDVRSITIEDPDGRVGDRINSLSEKEIGYHNVYSLTQDGADTKFKIEGTILEVKLAKPILPNSSSVLEMNFDAQVPVQIRRSGRNNAEGISYSMSQWYPKLCNYDYQGWHANPYVGREFYGIWGDFNVNITIDRKFTVAASGILTNGKKIGHGYAGIDSKKGGIFGKKKNTWKFKAENVHDFVWAADPDYKHLVKQTDDGVELHYFYQSNDKTEENWNQLHTAMNAALTFMNKKYGKYPYPVYSFIQGGDGGMEYPMATLITGERNYVSLVGVSIHEWMHSWYQMVLATNEALYPWMDEGFTSYGSAEVMNHLRELKLIPGEPTDNPHFNSVRGYARFSQSGKEEALSTHADHYTTNVAYGVGSYTKGTVFLKQLEYVLGKKKFADGLKRYYNEWSFKHPNVNDFIRVMEKTSDLELDWFKEFFVNSTRTIDYAIDTVQMNNKQLEIVLANNGQFPMPIDLTIELNSGKKINYNIPMRIMRGNKPLNKNTVLLEDWPWTHPKYIVAADVDIMDVAKITIDESMRLADVNLSNNVWPEEVDEDDSEK